ncbi:hypothetical protein CAI21_08565 [Alkalilimnicola ehrlichii]|uniref:Uncharacterized protein n=1 Tax=Alkalilimnicola ehrlichii TaxID=351052 RepID=A0A3E0WX23_9GAMM|nr:hypothetical protein [Alkalilimnicola ehrlichii]RFA29877.1 hypothetical protein CAI21_08565 [Alkalilimnicola ehrlichii]RFA36467.1 hypothetical protein CAL65_10840 [Alkalilimnicola ehrlichii]
MSFFHGPLKKPESRWWLVAVGFIWFVWFVITEMVIDQIYYAHRVDRHLDGFYLLLLLASLGFLVVIAQGVVTLWKQAGPRRGVTAALMGLLPVAVLALHTLAQAIVAAPPEDVALGDLQEIREAIDALIEKRMATEGQSGFQSVELTLNDMRVLDFNEVFVVFGRPKSYWRRMVPQSISAGPSLPKAGGCCSQKFVNALHEVDFAELHASVDAQLNDRGGIEGLEKRYGGEFRPRNVSRHPRRYLSWKYPGYTLVVIEPGPRFKLEKLAPNRLRLSSDTPQDTRFEGRQRVARDRAILEFRSVFGLSDGSEGNPYGVRRPRPLGTALPYGPWGLWAYVTQESPNYFAALRVLFHRDPWQPALREAGACWLTDEGCD